MAAVARRRRRLAQMPSRPRAWRRQRAQGQARGAGARGSALDIAPAFRLYLSDCAQAAKQFPACLRAWWKLRKRGGRTWQRKRSRQPRRSPPCQEEKARALEAARLQIEKQFGKGSLMKLGEDAAGRTSTSSPRAPSCSTPPSASAAIPGAGSSRSTAPSPRARPPSPCTPSPRPRSWAASPPSSTPSTPWTRLRQEPRRQHRRAVGVAAGHGRAGPRDRGIAGALGRGGHHRRGLGGRPHPAGRDRGRHGRLPHGPAGPAHEPGAAQAHRHHLQDAAPASSSSTRSA